MGFMTYEMHYKGQISHAEQKGFARGVAKGIAEGVAEGEARKNALIDKLLADDRIDDLKRSTTDEAFCSELYKEYGL
jgi:flagellar biosynthesis/type III secretory pathway protein FliH